MPAAASAGAGSSVAPRRWQRRASPSRPGCSATRRTRAAAQAATATAQPMLDLAEWSYFFVGVERAELARASYVNGKQMYVESFIPAQVRHPYSDRARARRRRAGTGLVGHAGRAPRLGADAARGGLQGLRRRSAGTRPIAVSSGRQRSLRGASQHAGGHLGQVHAAQRRGPDNGPYRKLHKQWPGTGELGSKDLDQFVASQGGSYVNTAAPGAPPAGGRGAAADGGRGAGRRWPPAPAEAAPTPAPAAPAVLGQPAHRRADRIRSTSSGGSAARCCSTRSAPRSS